METKKEKLKRLRKEFDALLLPTKASKNYAKKLIVKWANN